MYNRGKYLILLISVYFFVTACTPKATVQKKVTDISTNNVAKKIEEIPLDQQSGWLLQQITDKNGQLLPVESSTRITLTFKDTRVMGTNGCNNYFAGYTSQGKQLSISTLSTTLMACAKPEMQLGKTYLEQLPLATSYQIKANQLKLLNAKNQTILIFLVDDPANLFDTKWMLQSINTGNALVSSANISTITARFSKHNNLKGFAGCNKYGAVYSMHGNKFQILKPIAFESTCNKPKGIMETEAQFMAALLKVTRYGLGQQMLTFFDDKNTKVLVFKQSK